jgi:hypothetical protein
MEPHANLIKRLYYKHQIIRMTSFFLDPRCYQYSKLQCFFSNCLNKKNSENENSIHIKKALEWLLRSYAVTKTGSSATYSLHSGWMDPYPETTGYIIETLYDSGPYFLDYFGTGNASTLYRTCALNMGSWLLDIQLEEGGFSGGTYSTEKILVPNVFNSGQILLGLLRCYTETGDNRFLDSSIKAGDWLVKVQNPEGTWTKFTYEGEGRSYHARVSWPLLELYNVTKNESYKNAAIANLDWVSRNFNENGWCEATNFFDKTTTLTHTLAYSLRGLLESGIILSRQDYIDKVTFTAEKIMRLYEIRKYDLIPALFDKSWNATANYSCLTGCAQISLIMSKIYLLTEDIRFFNTALKINSALKQTQILSGSNQNIIGGIQGSYPIYGGYMPMMYPNWATKFFVDALLYEDKIMKSLEGSI